jgi:hypothetical protein
VKAATAMLTRNPTFLILISHLIRRRGS